MPALGTLPAHASARSHDPGRCQIQSDQCRNNRSRPLSASRTAEWLDDPNYTATDGNASAQQSAASAWLNLGGYSSQVYRVFWHEYEAIAAGWE
jgi:hypothetical protein